MVRISVSRVGRTGEEVEFLVDRLLIELLASAGIEESDIATSKSSPDENYVVLNEEGIRKLAEYLQEFC